MLSAGPHTHVISRTQLRHHRMFPLLVWTEGPMRWRKIPCISLLAVLLCGCSAYTQASSGQDWLAGYGAVQPAAYNASDDIDARVRQAGAVEPTLHFPARI